MKLKEKICIGIMAIVFCSTAGMFYVQTVQIPEKIEKNKQMVLVATEDILPNTTISTDDLGWKKIDSAMIDENYTLKQEEAIGKKVTEKIYEGEFINKKRLVSSEDDSSKKSTYLIDIVPDYSSDIQQGDLIKVYLLKKNKDATEVEHLLVLGQKEVVVSREESSMSKNEKYITVEVTDEEALKYYQAREQGVVIALRYTDEINSSDIEVPEIKLSNEIKNQTSIESKPEPKKEDVSVIN